MFPLLFLSFITPVVFGLPPDSGEKMSTCITVLLAYSFYMIIITDYFPDTSLHTSLLGLYLTTLFGICTLTVIATAIILHFHFKPNGRPVGKLFTRFGRWISIKEDNTDIRVNDIVAGIQTMKPQQLHCEDETPGAKIRLEETLGFYHFVPPLFLDNSYYKTNKVK